MQSTLAQFTIKKATVFATGGNSTALFCGVKRWGLASVCVPSVCMYIWQRPSIKHGTRKFANKPDRMTLVASLQMTNAIDNRHWFNQAAGISYISLIGARNTSSHPSRVPALPHVGTLQFASHMSPAIKLFSAAVFGLFPTNLANVSFYAGVQRVSGQLMSPACATHFSLFAFLHSSQVFSLRICLKGAKSLGMQRPKRNHTSPSPSSCSFVSFSCSFRPGAD